MINVLPNSSVSLLIMVALATAGCGEPNPLGRKAIEGTVIFNGGPLAHGLIEFSPKDPDGVSTGASISAGDYRIEAHQGVPPGMYTVRITSPTGSVEEDEGEEEIAPPGPQERGPRQPPPAKERIPPNYNVRSDQVVTVTEDDSNRFDFEIKSSK